MLTAREMTRLATVVMVLPEQRDELERMVIRLIENTPDDAYDVILVNTGVPAEVLDFAERLEGDLQIVGEAGASLDSVLQGVLSGGHTAPTVVVIMNAGASFQPGWLEHAARQSTAISVLEPGISIAVKVGEVHGSTDLAPFLVGSSPEPPVLADLGPHFQQDLNELMSVAARGEAFVGNLPMAAAERIRERLELEEDRRLLLLARDGRDVCWPDEQEDEPLVTIRIPTYNQGQRALDTSIRAALSQTYKRIEVLLIGDGCASDVADVYRSIHDDRVQFINLPVRGTYPQDPWLRWLVAGVPPVNFALQLARGSWIAPCDDDDEFTPDHVEVLLAEARSRRLEMVWSKAEMETPEGWNTVGNEPLGPGNITHGSALYSSGLRFLKLSNTCWKMNEPADGNFWRRMSEIGVRTGFVDRVTYRHYLEGRFRENLQGPQSVPRHPGARRQPSDGIQ